MKRNILPARPLRLRASAHLKSALAVLLLLGLATGLGLAVTWFASQGATILRDKEVWARGVTASDGTIDAKRTSKLTPWLMASYAGTVRYVDAEGARYEGSIDFWTLLGGPDTDTAELRYDPDHHERFAISWGVEASGARWRAVITFSLLFSLLVLVFVYGAWAVAQNARAQARVAAAGDEVELRVVSATPVVKDGKPTGAYHYTLELELGDQPPRQIHRESPWLLTTSGAEARAVGLWRPGDERSLILIHRDLAPLAVRNDERAEILARAESPR